MGFLSRLFGGAVQPAVPPFELLCAQAGLRIGDRHGSDAFDLVFDGEFGVRRVFLTWGGRMAVFSVRSAVSLPASRLTPEMGYGLLMRNRDTDFAAWHMFKAGDDQFGFMATFCTLSAGIDAEAIRTICVKLCEEVAFVDTGLLSNV